MQPSFSTSARSRHNTSPLTRYWKCSTPLKLELGGQLPCYELAYRSWGRLSPNGDNAVVVCHALTGSADVDDWWGALFGDGCALDPQRDFILCSNVLGGCSGSTGPASMDVYGHRYGASFPALTIRDQVRAQMGLADALGIRRIKLVIGGSMGGLQALEWALLDDMRVESIAVIAASARHSAWCISWSEAQRMALRADSKFRDGNYDPDDPPLCGLGAARAIAMTTYRSAESLNLRYGRENGASAFGQRAQAPDDFAVRGWLHHHAAMFVERFDANCYLALLDAMDRHDVGYGRGGACAALKRITQPALVVTVSSDALYPPADQLDMYRELPDAEYVPMQSSHGHDGFLIDAAQLAPHVANFRRRSRRLPESRTAVLSGGMP